MADLISQANDVYRDFATDGVPASGPNDPPKPDIRVLLKAYATAIHAAQQGMQSYATSADLPTDPAPAEGTQARVYADDTDTNNGVWIYKDGAWAFDSDYYDAAQAAIQPKVDLAEAWATSSTEPDPDDAPGEQSAKTYSALASAIWAAINAMFVATPPGADYMLGIADADGRFAGGIRSDMAAYFYKQVLSLAAVLEDDETTTLIDRLLPGSITSMLSVGSSESGYAFPILDADGRIIGGIQFDDDSTSGSDVAAIKSDLYPTDNITWWGDSLTENWTSFATTLAMALTAAGDTKTRTFTRDGLGGQTAAEILGRQGGRLARVTFPTGDSGFPEIPASGAATVTLDTQILDHPGTSNAEAQSRSGIVQVQGGIAGTLTRAAGGTTYTFTRTTAGDVVEVPAGVAFKPDTSDALHGSAICWIGTNDMNADADATTIFAAIEGYVAAQATLEKRCVIILPHWLMGSASDATRRGIYDDLLALLWPKYGDRLIDIIGELQPYGDGGANDNADIAAGLIPRSLFQTGSRVHFDDGGTAYGVIADRVAQIFVRNGW